MDCMKHEMHSWDREQRARKFAAGCVLVLVGIVFVAVVPDSLTSFGFGGLMIAGGVAIIKRNG